MKKIVVLTLVFALLALAVTPAFAQGGKGKNMNGAGGGGDQIQNNYAYAGEEVFSVAGVVTAVAAVTDPLTGVTTGSVTLDLVAGNHLVHDLLDVELPTITVVITDTTRIVQACNAEEIDCTLTATLAVGQNVTIKGLTDGTIYTAQHITIGAALTGTLLQSPQFQNRTNQPEGAGTGAGTGAGRP
jgi:hypothetical protein